LLGKALLKTDDSSRRPWTSPGTARAKHDWPPFFSKCSMVARTASRASKQR
jgi:hypothetical protein